MSEKKSLKLVIISVKPFKIIKINGQLFSIARMLWVQVLLFWDLGCSISVSYWKVYTIIDYSLCVFVYLCMDVCHQI